MNAASPRTSFKPQQQAWPQLYGAERMAIARGKSTGTVREENDPNCSRVSTNELVDFVQERARRLSIKDVSRLTGLSNKAVVHLREGTAGASAQTISTWCRNDPQFRAEYFQFCGGFLETDPEMVAGISRMLNGYARRLHGASAFAAPDAPLNSPEAAPPSPAFFCGDAS